MLNNLFEQEYEGIQMAYTVVEQITDTSLVSEVLDEIKTRNKKKKNG